MSGQSSVPPTNVPAAPIPARAEVDAGALDDAWLADGELVDAAYAETMAAADIQTSLPPPEPPPPPPPEWLVNLFDAIGDFFAWSGPALKIALWVAAAGLVLLLLYRFVPSFAAWVDARRRKPVAEEDRHIGVAEASVARARLADADALARDGRFAEAVHLLLARSVDDIAARRPGLVQPALTSRDIAGAKDLPGVARGAFAHIARAVEISLFGGRAVDAAVWDDCRAAYSELTIAKNWAAA